MFDAETGFRVNGTARIADGLVRWRSEKHYFRSVARLTPWKVNVGAVW